MNCPNTAQLSFKISIYCNKLYNKTRILPRNDFPFPQAVNTALLRLCRSPVFHLERAGRVGWDPYICGKSNEIYLLRGSVMKNRAKSSLRDRDKCCRENGCTHRPDNRHHLGNILSSPPIVTERREDREDRLQG